MTNAQAAAAAAPADDHRSAKEVMRQYDRLRIVKSQLVRGGTLNADATPDQIIAELRRQIPADLF